MERLLMSRAYESRSEASLVLNGSDDYRYKRNAFGSLLLLMGAIILTLNPEWFNRPVARLLAALSRDHQLATDLAKILSVNATLHGVIMVALLWYCWFKDRAHTRAVIGVGVSGAILAGILSRFLQRHFPTYPRPIYDPALQSQGGSAGELITWAANTFPSERATLFAGLAIVIFLVRLRLGLLAIGYTLMVDVARIYLGLHYPADLLGSVAIAAFFVWITQMPWGVALGRALLVLENRSPALFYTTAFFVSYQMATAFADLRAIISSFYRLSQ
jgi:membrane-associated phospholipid phosphatase